MTENHEEEGSSPLEPHNGLSFPKQKKNDDNSEKYNYNKLRMIEDYIFQYLKSYFVSWGAKLGRWKRFNIKDKSLERFFYNWVYAGNWN